MVEGSSQLIRVDERSTLCLLLEKKILHVELLGLGQITRIDSLCVIAVLDSKGDKQYH